MHRFQPPVPVTGSGAWYRCVRAPRRSLITQLVLILPTPTTGFMQVQPVGGHNLTTISDDQRDHLSRSLGTTATPDHGDFTDNIGSHSNPVLLTRSGLNETRYSFGLNGGKHSSEHLPYETYHHGTTRSTTNHFSTRNTTNECSIEMNVFIARTSGVREMG